MQEQDLPTSSEEGGDEEAAHPPFPSGTNLVEGFDYDARDHAEDHPSGKQHIFLAACSCFSFEAVPRHYKSMASIHHPNVPLW
jgi:hypothetical protein|eukprot:COSAG06_NODE_5548_length_3411_cov_3.141002_4_plen_83_part_00